MATQELGCGVERLDQVVQASGLTGIERVLQLTAEEEHFFGDQLAEAFHDGIGVNFQRGLLSSRIRTRLRRFAGRQTDQTDWRSEMRTIERDQLKAKLDGGEDIKLIMALPDWAYRASHIPGSLHFDNTEQLLSELDVDDEIIVYCSDPICVASQFAYQELERAGFTNIARYRGGLSDWEAAGYPLEGTQHE